MSDSFYKIKKGLGITPTTLPAVGNLGDIACDLSGVLKRWNGSAWVDVAGVSTTDLNNHISDTTTHGTTGAIVGTSDAQVLTNKDFDGGTASNTSRITLPKNTKTNLDGLTRKEGTIVYASDEDKVYYDDGTVLKAVGSGSGGAVNFISNGAAEAGTTGWATYNDGFVTTPVDGTGGTASNLTFTVSGTSPLSGASSFVLSKAAANSLGQGVSYDFTIDNAQKAKMLKIEFDYIVDSGIFKAKEPSATSDLIVYIYDVTNSKLIEPSSISLQSNSSTISDKYQGYFQTSPNSTSYRLLLHIARPSADAWALKIDNVAVSPSEYVAGTIITDWTSYTPTISAASGTLTNYTLSNTEWAQVGDSLYMRGKLTFTGAVGTWTYPTIGFPPGLSATSQAIPMARVNYNDQGNNSYDGEATFEGASAIRLISARGSNGAYIVVSNTSPFTFASGDIIDWTVGPIKIQGWSAGAQMSDGYDGRQISASQGLASSAAVAQEVLKLTTAKATDTVAAYDTTTGRYNIRSAGTYRTFGQITANSSGATTLIARIRKNGSIIYSGTAPANAATNNLLATTGGIIDCVAGDYIELYSDYTANNLTHVNNSAGTFLSIEKLSGSAFMSPLPETMMLATLADGTLTKADSTTPCFTKTGAQTISIKAKTGIMVDKSPIYFHTDTAIVMPTLTTGTDYAIYVCKDYTVRADANQSAPTGYDATNSRKIGGFHYSAVSPTETVAGGSFATTGNGMIWTQGDVDKLKGINQFSIWDLKFRPACSDPRGMALVANRFWVDIYFCNTNPEVNGTSKYNSDVASGTVLPKKPTMFGGNGTATYANLNGWTANELARAFGKRFMKESEFVVAAFGVTEDQSLGGASSTITNAIRQPGYTSKWGLEQATGHHYIWGEDTSIRPTYAADAWGWQDVNGDRGQRHLINSLGESRILLGGARDSAANSGSRAAGWSYCPWGSSWSIGLRAACDHLQIP